MPAFSPKNVCRAARLGSMGSIPTVLMGATFGLYHLFYATLNWRRSR